MAQAFNKREHATTAIQHSVGLGSANCNTPRKGDRTMEGDSGYSVNTSYAHMDPFKKHEAVRLWEALPDAIKDNPGSPEMAKVLGKTAMIAGEAVTPGIRAAIGHGGEPEPDDVTIYIAPGGPLFKGIGASNKFISFLFLNMDPEHRVKWYDLTGREQYEWYQCWLANAQTHQAMPATTVGLRGTDLDRITTVPELEAALVHTPTLKDRRPAGHAVTDVEWADSVRHTLFG